ncbi:MAG: M28 family peptidase [Agriterribacter sp.]
MKKLIVILALLPVLPSLAQKMSNPKSFADIITAADLKKNLYIVAGDEMEGRETATEGQRKAASFIENEFKSLGLLPGNNGSYQMQYPVYADSLLRTSIAINNTSFSVSEDFSFSLSANYTAAYNFSEAVFVGYGISDSTRDDYKGIDAKGKLVLVFSGNISGNISPTSKKQFNFYTQQQTAMKNGAMALLVVEPNINPVVPKGNMYVNEYQSAYRVNTFFISEKMATTIMGDKYSSEKAATQKGNNTSSIYKADVAIDFSKARNTMQSSNVLGLMEGTDLKDQYVILSAHYDHLGKKGEVIWHGADDDGSGTVTILQLAKAFAKAKAEGKGPRRSILFMTVSGEEKGLWGSDYYSSHPAFPLDKTTVDLNVDMVGRIDPTRKYGDSTNYVYVIGDDKLSSDLKPISEGVNKKYSKLELDYKYNNPNDPERIYYRSDHYNFAKHGVPIIFYFNGIHADYHKPTDTPDKINYELMRKRARLVFFTAWEMANRQDMLKRDIPLK